MDGPLTSSEAVDGVTFGVADEAPSQEGSQPPFRSVRLFATTTTVSV